jgi:hypothetical protein
MVKKRTLTKVSPPPLYDLHKSNSARTDHAQLSQKRWDNSGGAGTVPSFIVPVLFISYLQINFSESPFFLGGKSTKNKTHQKCDENSGKKSQDEKHNGMSFSMTRST